tara:strand:- start:5126 stop:5626 length:501 start_codon:yes stop_codon:yes gene_type:complete
MIKLKHTNRTMHEVGDMLRKGLRQELIDQKHNATGRLSRGLKYHVNKRTNTMSVFASVSYWKAVNNPKFAKKPNKNAIKSWVRTKGLPENSASAIFKKLQSFYGKPYVFWSDGNKITRTDFAGHTARKFSKKVADKLAPSIGVDVANMIGEQIRKNNPKANVVEAF